MIGHHLKAFLDSDDLGQVKKQRRIISKGPKAR